MAYFQTDNLWVNRLEDGVADLVLDVADTKVNALKRVVFADIDQALDRVAHDATFRLLVMRTAKGGSFCAGMAPATIAAMTPAEFSDVATQGQELCTKLAALRLPTVAIVSGGCLGGGLELALACDYRIAVDKPTTIFGFPELELGLIPMWGGTQRLPRLVGLDRALQMLLGGRRLPVRAARAWGLVDEIVEEGNVVPPAFLDHPHKRAPAWLPLRTFRQKLVEATRLGRWLIFRRAKRLLRKRLPDDMPAPWQALDLVRTGLRAGVEAGLARERAAALDLVSSEACRNLVRLHVERDKFRAPVKKVRQQHRAVGVVGAGSQSAHLIYMALSRGYQVVMREASEAALGYALFSVVKLFQDDVARGTMAPVRLKRYLGNIRGTTAWKGFEDLDLVLDATEAEPETKRALFRELEKQTPASAMLVTTGRSVGVGELQEELAHPGRVAGLHFLTPVARSLLVEVVASDRTHADVSRRLMDFVVAMGRTPWPVNDQPGLLIERLLIPYFNEAILLVKGGMDPAEVDEAMARFGMMHGPLEYLDLLGLDAAAALVQALRPVLEPRLVVEETFAYMAQQQWFGHKAGIGFYRYRGKRRKGNAALAVHLGATSRGQVPTKMRIMSKADRLALARQRLVLCTINEAAWCLKERRAESPDALDLALTLAGWAPHRGGPFHYARHVGSATIIGEMEKLAIDLGPRFTPCPSLPKILGESQSHG